MEKNPCGIITTAVVSEFDIYFCKVKKKEEFHRSMNTTCYVKAYMYFNFHEREFAMTIT